jgi:hypothetical protein
MGWAGHEGCTLGLKNAYRISLETLKGRDLSEDLVVDERIILEWTLGMYSEKLHSCTSGLGQRQVVS